MIHVVPEIREILVTLAQRYAFRELSYLIGTGATGLALSQRDIARVQQMCAYGQRLFDLDAEDLANADAATGASTDTTFIDLVGDELVPPHLLARGRRCHVRQQAAATEPDALASLRPAFRLLLEVIRIRWHRKETLGLLAAVHIAAEYGAAVAWEPVLGHAADPARLRPDPAFAGPDSRWGHDDPLCPQTRPEKSAAARALRVATEPPSGWRAYLDRQHSSVSHALGVCASGCPHPCTVVTALPSEERPGLSERCRIALAFQRCGLVKLRHRAPVGHGFGVPSTVEVARAWQRSREGLARRGGLGQTAMDDDGFVLPGLQSLFGGLAGTPLTPETLLADIVTEIVHQLDPTGAVPALSTHATVGRP
jgi:hypothetical protein